MKPTDNASDELSSVKEQISGLEKQRRFLEGELDFLRRLLKTFKQSTKRKTEKLPKTSSVGVKFNRTDFARDLILKNSSKGTIPMDIYRALASEGKDVSKNSVYSFLQRLSKAGEIKKRGKKWFPTEKLKVIG